MAIQSTDSGNEENCDYLVESVATEVNEELTDSEDEDEFIRKYGAIEFQYIKRPRDAVWFIRPHALNYFKDGVLFRTKGERTSAKTELFLDLMYVGIIANLAGEASENASWGALYNIF
ncbi:CIC11C00000006039 [Sungouiella intermedia]|uniref:CIC11C00000006039 n=1 Tax=Sungouiella intermedia TaxID=45354 RepID=A0A1L0GAW4_9ASCO|nr:CIC11C00000006039 [[Candida] intermedia]